MFVLNRLLFLSISIKLMEKHTEHIGYNYITKLLNISEYNTTGNSKLFNTKIPDGWLISADDHNLLIIEYKANIEDKKKGIKQLLNYSKLTTNNISKFNNTNNSKLNNTNNSKLNNTNNSKDSNYSINNIYCFLGIGLNEDNFIKLFMEYNKEDNSLYEVNEDKIKEIFSNSIENVNIQSIHNMLVSNFHFDKAEELHDLLTIILSSFVNDELIEYYKIKDNMITKEFIDLLISNALGILGTAYIKYLNTIKQIEFKNCFKICKLIYEAYQNDYHIIAKLF